MRNPTALLATLLLALLTACVSGPAPQPSGAAAGATLTADQAGDHVGQSAVVRFTVTKVGFSKDNVFINSQRERGGFLLFIPSRSRDEFTKAFGLDLKGALEGKTVEASGEIALYKDAPQMVLKAPGQLKVVP